MAARVMVTAVHSRRDGERQNGCWAVVGEAETERERERDLRREKKHSAYRRCSMLRMRASGGRRRKAAMRFRAEDNGWAMEAVAGMSKCVREEVDYFFPLTNGITAATKKGKRKKLNYNILFFQIKP
ncbi:unnamed protein product [Citrullus colocynthis]|uniref:Uncharacterized protein n=1 Tax=Citrullus colocynthis TaxID=252529 RepID=A0ABP0ZAX5_9ROSI